MESPEEGCPRYMPEVIAKKNVYDPTIEAIIKRIRERSEAGMIKYGQSMRDNNKKSFQEWIEDVQEELYDAIAYLEKIKELLIGVRGG